MRLFLTFQLAFDSSVGFVNFDSILPIYTTATIISMNMSIGMSIGVSINLGMSTSMRIYTIFIYTKKLTNINQHSVLGKMVLGLLALDDKVGGEPKPRRHLASLTPPFGKPPARVHKSVRAPNKSSQPCTPASSRETEVVTRRRITCYGLYPP